MIKLNIMSCAVKQNACKIPIAIWFDSIIWFSKIIFRRTPSTIR